MHQNQKSSWADYNSPRQRQNSSPSSPSMRSEQLSRRDEIDEQWDVIVETNFVKKVGSNQNQRFESDFTVQDQDKRNILHQTALRQDAKILELLIQDYQNLLKENKKQERGKLQRKISQIKHEEDEDEQIIEIDFDCEDYQFSEIQDQVKKYVQQPDIFGCTPIQICCFLNDPKYHQNRQECLKILIENGSDVNEVNPHNQWRPLHWCSYYGDEASVKLLLQNKAFSFLCDNNGLYPLDLAGKNKHKQVLEQLIENLVTFLKDCQLFWNNDLRGKKEGEFIEFQEICSKYESELQNPLLYTKLLFWCCKYGINGFIKPIIQNLPRIYIMYPIKSLDSQTCLHACCSSNNAEALKQIIKFEIIDLSTMKPDQEQTRKKVKKDRKRDEYHYKFMSQYLEQITRNEIQGINQILQRKDNQIYKERYYHELQRYLQQDQIYKEELSKVIYMILNLKDQKTYDQAKSYFCRNVLNINVKDNHGNTPLHLASLNGDQKIIKFLLNKYADPEAENNEFFRAKQLTRDLTTQIYYDGLIKKQKYVVGQVQLLQSFDQIFKKHKQNKQKIITKFEDQYNLTENIKNKSKYYRQQLKTRKQGKKLSQKKKQQTISKFDQNDSSKITDLRTSNAKENSNLILKPKKTKKATNKIIPLNFQPQPQNVKKPKNSYDHVEQLMLFSSQLFVPDIVIKFDQSVKVNLIDFFKLNKSFKLDDQQKLIEQQINFQIDLLQKAEFEIYMMLSFISKDYIYLMLRIKESKLEKLAQEMEMQIKLIDSYDLEQFKKKQRNQFEPFRSSQRQKIVYEHLIKSINLESLIKSKLIDSCYAMHTSGGIQIVKKEWQKLYYGFIPQPICQIKDYLSEGSGRNFTSLTTMRLYFGEQISFFFAWISYLSCISLIIAIPGLILQIYVIVYDFHSEILPYWALIVTIWSTVQTELWKRKTSEINTRWGCIDQMLQVESSYYEGPLKDKFSGDEEINNVSKKLTKHQQITKMAAYFAIFLILLAIFLLGSFGIVYGIDQLRREVQSYKGVVFLLGALQAIAIQILNILFHYFSKWYADQENHKFELSYEKSLIYKNVFFRFINSYMPLVYIIVTGQNYTLEDIFYFLIPLVLVKKAYYILIDFLIPAMIIRAKIKIYFSKVKDVYQTQKQFKKTNNTTLTYLDEIEQFWTYDEFNNNKNQQSQSQQDSIEIALLESASRTVLKVESEEIMEEKLLEQSQNPKLTYQPFETKIDTDAIELNSFKEEFGGTLDYFMEAITDYGYFILFSAAFPIGPFVGIILNIVEIQMKLYKLIYMTKRIKSERMPGIGQWLNILEFLSAMGVFTNFVLLYFKHKDATLKMFTNDIQQIKDDDLELWYFISCVIAVTLIKILVRELIPDRPDWVTKEIDKINHRELVEQQEKAKQKLKDMEKLFKELREENIKLKKDQAELEQITELKTRQLDAEINKLEQQFQDLSKFKKIDKLVMTEYDMIVLNVLKIRYYQFDNILLTKRILQLIEAKSCIIQICQECGKTSAILECLQCQENFCAICYQKLHSVMQQLQHQVKLKVKKNEILEQIELNVIQDEQVEKPKMTQEFQQFKKQIGFAHPKRNWKKIEYFFIPLQIQSGSPKLNDLYAQFGEFYLKSTGLEFRDFKIVVEKILPAKDVIIVDDPTMRLEDKIFLNRIAFQLFRKKKHSAEVQQFLRQCTILQTGQLEQRIFMFFDFLDINEDDQITKAELEGLFFASLVQDVRTNKRVYEIVDQFFPNKVQARFKRDISQEFFNKVNRGDEFRTFLEGLLQVQGVKC